MTDISFNNWVSLSDSALAKHIGAFIRHHRMEQGKTQDTLATGAGISRSTLSLLERGETVTLSTLIRVLRTLDHLEVMSAFTVNDSASPLALARLQKAGRKRARSKPVSPNEGTDETPDRTEW